ncbi:glycosyltransferase family 4 protein [Singulisphaera sp. Ch08]|uniref:Glycosyltransferase family 4 protein n=1 Tax=Singulisphaera sp. Ch08 TaxID=3120278 RepID=A0AAU7CRQ5_9BACT
MESKPRLGVLTHVMPYPRNAGQQQRVYYTLKAAREEFHVTLIAPVRDQELPEARKHLDGLCDELLVLPSIEDVGRAARLSAAAKSLVYCAATGLRRSNYYLGGLQFDPSVVRTLIADRQLDCLLFEYWHAYRCVESLRDLIPKFVLDMHNVLWVSHAQKLNDRRDLPGPWKRWSVARYRTGEERAWRMFDGVIAINQEELKYASSVVNGCADMFYAPMGIDLGAWPYSWSPQRPARVAYYGGLGSPHNQQAALRCLDRIMPEVWDRAPETTFWLVGSNPQETLLKRSEDPRVRVTGFVEDVQQVLRTMTAVVCPWSGPYGFRSRLVEVMALGVPVVTTLDAVSGMELENGQGILVGEADNDLARQVLRLLNDDDFAAEQSHRARSQVEGRYDVPNTYGKLMKDLKQWSSP